MCQPTTQLIGISVISYSWSGYKVEIQLCSPNNLSSIYHHWPYCNFFGTNELLKETLEGFVPLDIGVCGLYHECENYNTSYLLIRCQVTTKHQIKSPKFLIFLWPKKMNSIKHTCLFIHTCLIRHTCFQSVQC